MLLRSSLGLKSVVLGVLLAPSLALAGCGGSSADPVTPPVAPPPTSTTLRATGLAHGIIIGSAADPSHLAESNYATTLGSEFRQLEPENQMKFQVIHPRPNTDPQPYDFSAADQLVAFATAQNMVVRGHCFVWHNQISDWVTAGIANNTIDSAQLSDIIQSHIATVAAHYAGKVWAWDVVNEAFNDDGTLRSTPWYDQPGIGFAGKGTAYIEQAFKWAHAADPAAKLFYNDYGAELSNAKSDAIFAMAKDFKARGVPIDGIGFQLHVGLYFADPAQLASFAQNVKRFSDLGLEVHFTELDIALDSNSAANLSAQADLYKKITQVCVQTANCKVIQTWGFTDKYSWIPGFSKGKQGWALPFDDTYGKKPAYQSILDGLNGK